MGRRKTTIGTTNTETTVENNTVNEQPVAGTTVETTETNTENEATEVKVEESPVENETGKNLANEEIVKESEEKSNETGEDKIETKTEETDEGEVDTETETTTEIESEEDVNEEDGKKSLFKASVEVYDKLNNLLKLKGYFRGFSIYTIFNKSYSFNKASLKSGEIKNYPFNDDVLVKLYDFLKKNFIIDPITLKIKNLIKTEILKLK